MDATKVDALGVGVVGEVLPRLRRPPACTDIRLALQAAKVQCIGCAACCMAADKQAPLRLHSPDLEAGICGLCSARLLSAPQKPSPPEVTRWLGSSSFMKDAISLIQAGIVSSHSGTCGAEAPQ